MKKLICAFIATAACVVTGLSLANVDFVMAFAGKAANTAACAAGLTGLPPYAGDQAWCGSVSGPAINSYLGQAVAACKASCTYPPQPLAQCSNFANLSGKIKVNVGLATQTCNQENAKGYLPAGVTVASCISEWQAYAAHC